ncbi:MAG TPA: ABC transporter substrate-binding protein [Nitrososphaeraceae archaeon]|nr:ABC transporter substrate-binding protein [Nitrososphaeraceae archaeon]
MNKKILVSVIGLLLVGVIVQPFISNHVYSQEKKVLKIGFFPNINHAQAVIGIGNGDFQKALGGDVEIKTFLFNAGPSAIEALLARQVDLAYIGPNPAINGYVVSEGKSLKIIAGVSSGGAVFVVRNDSGINSVKDFAGKKFASPQLGNTQDVALRKYLLDNGYNTKDKGGNVEILPVKNPDILTLLLKKEIDGAWVPEPWGEKMIKEGNSKLFLDERTLWPEGKFVTANIIVNPEYLQQNPEVIRKLLVVHVSETQWINSHKQEALTIFNTQLKSLTGQTIPEDQLSEAFKRLELTYDPVKQSLFESASDAFSVGFLGKTEPDLSSIYDLTILNEVLKSKGLKEIDENSGLANTTIQTNVTSNIDSNPLK